jgi:hypothetical protein
MQWSSILPIEKGLFFSVTVSHSADGGLTTPATVLGFFIDADHSCVWRCSTDLHVLRPGGIKEDLFAKLFSEIFQWQMHPEHTIFSVHPSPLSYSTALVRLDVSYSVKDGHASVAVASFHCSLCTDPSPLCAVFSHIGAQFQLLSRVAEQERFQREHAAQLEKRVTEAVHRKLADEEKMLLGFCAVLNEKKKRIRDLTARVDASCDPTAHPQSDRFECSDDSVQEIVVDVRGSQGGACKRVREDSVNELLELH